MNRKIKIATASALSMAMILSITACSEEGEPALTTNADYGPLTEYVSTVVDDYKASLEGSFNANIEVKDKIKYLGWWDIDETQGAAVLFKQVYGVPGNGTNIFEYTNVLYNSRYEKLTELVTGGDSPDIFQFEISNFPYTAAKRLFQPIDDVIDFSNSMWDKNREAMEKFKWDQKTYCAITTVNLDDLLFYRRSIVAENNLTDPYDLYKAGTWDWNSFLEMCDKFSDPANGKYCIDGWRVPDKFVSSTGKALIEINSEGKLQNNFYDADIERCMSTVVDTMFKENYRYPRHELNDWGINISEWCKGNILFYCDLSNAIKDTKNIQAGFKREGWEEGDVFMVPIPKDPNSDKYYSAMKNDSWMLCGGAQNTAGFAAWTLCSMATAYDEELARISDEKIMVDYLGYTQEILDHLRSLQFDGVLTPVFDFKGGIGTDIVTGVTEDPINALTNFPYLNGLGGGEDHSESATFTSLREQNIGVVQKRIDDLNNGNI